MHLGARAFRAHLEVLARGRRRLLRDAARLEAQASFGEAGVDRVLEIMDNEFSTIMRQVGALNINQITRDNVTRT